METQTQVSISPKAYHEYVQKLLEENQTLKAQVEKLTLELQSLKRGNSHNSLKYSSESASQLSLKLTSNFNSENIANLVKLPSMVSNPEEGGPPTQLQHLPSVEEKLQKEVQL